MSEESTDLLRRFLAAGDAGEFDRFGEFIAEDAVDHNALPGQPGGVEGAKFVFSTLKGAFPDLKSSLVEVITEGDKVAAVGTFSGTHGGSFMGIPATGRPIQVWAIDWVRVADGKMVEHWGLQDQGGLMAQLGVMPMPPGTEGWTPPSGEPPAGTPGTPEENKRLMRESVEWLAEGRMEPFFDLIHEDAIDHAAIPGQGPGREGVKFRLQMLQGLSEPRFRIVDQVAEGELVSGRYRFSGIHTGDMMGMPPTGKSFEVDAMDMVRFRDGKLVEHWGLIDFPSMMAQLGLMPAPRM